MSPLQTTHLPPWSKKNLPLPKLYLPTYHAHANKINYPQACNKFTTTPIINCFNNVASQTFFSKFMFLLLFRKHVTFIMSIMAMNITVHFDFK